jgi:hypothetical protein
MNERIKRLLLMQGFCEKDVECVPGISGLARWTPLSCAAFGTLGVAAAALVRPASALWMACGWFFIMLGFLTLTGGLTSRSIYDRLYNATIRRIFRTAPVPPHGAPRRFGCTIGGIMYTISGAGFLTGHGWLAFGPAVFMIVFAMIASLTQWCFASTLYAWLATNKSRTS